VNPYPNIAKVMISMSITETIASVLVWLLIKKMYAIHNTTVIANETAINHVELWNCFTWLYPNAIAALIKA